jgi:hypothetical protein
MNPRFRKFAANFGRLCSGTANDSWEEDKHHRTENGQFGSGGGSTTEPKSSGSSIEHHVKSLKSKVQNEGAYSQAITDLKTSKPSKDMLRNIVKDVTGFSVPASKPISNCYERLEKHGNSERRYKARAEFSRKHMPI